MGHIGQETALGLVRIFRFFLRLTYLIILAVDNSHISHLSDHPCQECNEHRSHKHQIKLVITHLIKLCVFMQIENLLLLYDAAQLIQHFDA